MSEQEHREDVEDLTAELKRRDMAHRFLAAQLAQHVEYGTRLEQALQTAMIFIDQLLSDLRVAGGKPSKNLLMAKMQFEERIRGLKKPSEETTYINADRGDPDAKT